MSFYPEEIIDEVIEENDIVSVIGSYVSLKKAGSSYVGLCPFHNEKTPSFIVTPSKRMFYCFGCHVGGSVITFIQKYEEKSFPEAVEMLGKRAGIKLPERNFTKEEQKALGERSKLLEIYKAAAMYYYKKLRSPEGTKGMDYLKRRGLNEETMRKFGLGYAGNSGKGLYEALKASGYDDEILKKSGLITYKEKGTYDKFWNRVMFPIMDVNNRVIAFGGRVLDDTLPKYLNSPETKIFIKSKTLYGLNVARHSKQNYLLICEGYMDVIALHNAGFTNAVAALGTAFGERNAAAIKKETDNVVLTFDSDLAGQDAALRAIPILKKQGFKIKVLDMTPYKDPDEFIKNLGKEAYQKRIDEACDSFIFRVKMQRKGHKFDTPTDQVDFYNEITTMLLEFRDELERNVYIEAVCDEFNIDKELLYKKVKERAKTYKPEDYSEENEEILNESAIITKQQYNRSVRPDGEGGIKKTQRMFFTWISDQPEYYEVVKKYISPKDFSEKLYETVANILFKQIEEKHLNTSKILTMFTDEEDAGEVAQLFNTPFDNSLKTPTGKELEKAVNEVVKKIKMYKIENLINNTNDAKELQELLNQEIEIKKMQIHL